MVIVTMDPINLTDHLSLNAYFVFAYSRVSHIIVPLIEVSISILPSVIQFFIFGLLNLRSSKPRAPPPYFRWKWYETKNKVKIILREISNYNKNIRENNNVFLKKSLMWNRTSIPNKRFYFFRICIEILICQDKNHSNV